jgi:hypothetical protein
VGEKWQYIDGCRTVVSTSRTTQAQGYRPGLVQCSQPLRSYPRGQSGPSRVRVGGCLTSRSSPVGRLWRQLASRGIYQGAQRVKAYLFALILSLCSSCDCRPRCLQSWTLILTPIQVHILQSHLLIGKSTLHLDLEGPRLIGP